MGGQFQKNVPCRARRFAAYWRPMNRQKLVGLLLAVLVVGFSATMALLQARDTSAKQLSQTPAVSAQVPTQGQGTSFTLAQVAAHRDASSCWSVVNGNVYDLTPWISQHPGGEQNILGMCGVDASAAFNAQHGGQRRPANELKGFEIGTLAR